ncbi:hypothetical protein COLO4_01399 [Corchorus olitorius]|uniref:Uncharacterized protein n=1 Tax=Corchorus olitorius TaxID=93759 RepID=A0A1R3L2K9_9ROSI|nr:hypothetical protein COLO4_01399 [Corchorus olitorius]
MVDLDAVFLQRQHVGAVVILEDPAVPQLGVGFLVLVAVLGAVFDDRADGGIDDHVVLPEGITDVAFQQQVVVRLLQHRHQHGMAVADVAGFVALHRQEDGGQGVVAIARRLRRHGDEQGVGEGGLGHDLEVDVRCGDGVAGQESLTELPADGGGVAFAERLLGDVEPGRVDVVLHVPFLEVHLDRRVPELVDHLHGEAGAKVVARRQLAQRRHRPGRRDFREGDDRQEQLHPLDPARLDVAEHVAAQGSVQRAIDAVVLLLLHREIGAQDLLHRVARRLGDLVVGREAHRLLDVGRRPAEVGDAPRRLGDADALLAGPRRPCMPDDGTPADSRAGSAGPGPRDGAAIKVRSFRPCATAEPGRLQRPADKATDVPDRRRTGRMGDLQR